MGVNNDILPYFVETFFDVIDCDSTIGTSE